MKGKIKPMGKVEWVANKIKYTVKSQITGETAYDEYMTYDELRKGLKCTDEEFEKMLKELIKNEVILRIFDKKKQEMGYVLNIDKINDIQNQIGVE